jgi:tRNA nucleotidyltransferase (CCA-adding enzyme)
MQFLTDLPFDRALLPESTYAVGGAVRDELLGRKRKHLDLDLVVPLDAIELARHIARHYRAGFVLLDAEYGIARVVFPSMTLDIATQAGETIATDLHRRDYTINAIACNFHTFAIIDPLQGRSDLEQKSLKMVSRDNLQSDPLRLLRGYRQAAQLNFQIDANTRMALQELAPAITQVAAERVLAEIHYLLAVDGCSPWLEMAMGDGALAAWVNPTPAPNLERGLADLDRAWLLLTRSYPALIPELIAPIKETIAISLMGIARLIKLLPDDRSAIVDRLELLGVSAIESKIILIAIDYTDKLSLENLSLEDLYFWFRSVGNCFPLLILLSISQGVTIDRLAPLITRYLNPEDIVAHPIPLVTGNDLIRNLNLKPSPQIGKLLTAIQLARISGKVSDFEGAIDFARSQL